MKTKVWILLLGVLAVAPDLSRAGNRAVVLTDTRLTVVTVQDTSLGAYYLLDVPIPAGIGAGNLQAAQLELAVNVSSREVLGQSSEAPMLEVYRVTGDATVTLSDETLARPSPATLNVVPGSSQRVRVDITDLVRDHFRGDGTGFQLALGSLSGSRTGLFEVLTGTWGAKSVARVTFVLRDGMQK